MPQVLPLEMLEGPRGVWWQAEASRGSHVFCEDSVWIEGLGKGQNSAILVK